MLLILSNKIGLISGKGFSGRYARGIKNAFIEPLDNSSYILSYPYQNKLTNTLRKDAKVQRNADFVSIWVGQSIDPYQNSSTEAILKALVREVEVVAD